MSAIFYPLPERLKDLEYGLKRLGRSQLMEISEFKKMFTAIDVHLRDVKLGHLTGKPKDLLSKAERDTKFYTILVKMLCEVQDQPTKDQSKKLRQVLSWYRTNNHVLFSGPRFGKDHFKAESEKTQQKGVMSKDVDHINLVKEQQPLGQSTELNHGVMVILEQVECQEDSTSPPRETCRAHEPGSEFNDERSTISESHSVTNSLDLDEFNPKTQLYFNDKVILTNQDKTSTKDASHTSARSSEASSPRILSRSKVDLPSTFSPLKEQPSCQLDSVTLISNVVHPISTLAKHHPNTAKILSKQTAVLQDDKHFTSAQMMIGKLSQSENFQTWQSFKKQKSNEQEVISKLSFLGRSGTPIDIRYSAHAYGERPEAYTQEFLEHFARHVNPLTKQQNGGQNIFIQKPLEEFYEAVENINPSTWKTFNNFLSAKVRSAFYTNQNRQDTKQKKYSDKKSKSTQDFGHNFEHFLSNWHGVRENVSSENDAGISLDLDTVMNVIDSVTDSMTSYKEKIAPEPQCGFRQPSATELTVSRDLNSSNSFDVMLDYSCTTPSTIKQNENEATRPFSSSLTSSTFFDQDFPDDHRQAKFRCISAETVDWRGRIQPEVIQYKCSKALFGGHTYFKKWRKPNQRSAGSTSAGNKPRTAPMTTKDKWKVQQFNDKNTRAIQAASHSTTIVDQGDVDSMMQVQHLLSHEKRSCPMDLFKIEDVEGKKYEKITAEPKVTEYLSFIAPSATVFVEPKREKYVNNPIRVEERRKHKDSSCSDLPHEDVNIHDSYYDKNALNIAVSEELQSSATDCTQQPGTLTTEKHEREIKKHPVSGKQLKPGHLVSEVYRPGSMTTKVQRSAGRMPDHLSSTSAHMQAFSHLQNNAMRGICPIRTPASIPTSQKTSSKFQSRSGQIFVELEHHARKTKNPAEYMTKVEGLRVAENSQHPSLITIVDGDSDIGSSLHIHKLPVPHREHSFLTISKNMPAKTESVVFSEHIPVSDSPEDSSIHRSKGIVSSTSNLTSGQGMPDGNTISSSRSISKTGRPVAQVFQTPDPDELFQAVQIQNEAAAAVDIQRIFRGYVARNVYKSLLSEERQRREEARKAAVRIQRLYRSHIRRKQAIYSRSYINPEMVQWSRDLAEIQARSSAKRQTKLASWTSKMSSKHKEDKSKLAVIGPHVEVYSAYHPKKVGPTKQELNAAAVKIQKVVKGWLLRRKLKKLAKKAIWYGSSFSKLAHDYKAMLKKVQLQHGVDKPKTPFSIKDFNAYIDLRRRYESVFEKRSFGEELEYVALEAFFKECDLYPSRTEIEEAIDVTTHGQANRRGKKGVTKKELLDLIFYIYVPRATGLRETRKSTWMSPIINGHEAKQMLGSEFVEPAPLAPCIKLVIEAKRAQRQREQTQKDAEQRIRIEEAEKRIEEDKQTGRKSKKVMFQKTLTNDS